MEKAKQDFYKIKIWYYIIANELSALEKGFDISVPS